MNVAEIIEARQANRLGEALQTLLDRRGMTQSDLARTIYGVDAGGKAKYSGNVSQIFGGHHLPNPETLTRYAQALDVDPAELLALRSEIISERNAVRVPGEVRVPLPKGKPPKALPAPVPLDPEPDEQPPQFSLVIDHAGTATLRLNLVGVPMKQAMRAMGALTSAGILDGGEQG